MDKLSTCYLETGAPQKNDGHSIINCMNGNIGVDIFLVGRVPKCVINAYENKDNFIREAKEFGFHIRLGEVSNLPPRTVPVNVIVVTKQSDCDSGNPSKVLVEACRRKWQILTYDYILDCMKGDSSYVDQSKYTLNLEKLQQNLSARQCVIPPGVIHFGRPKKLRPITEIKKKRESFNKNTGLQKKRRVLKSRPQSGYALFFSQNFSKVEKCTMKERHVALKRKWAELSEDGKHEWTQKAFQKFQEPAHPQNQ